MGGAETLDCFYSWHDQTNRLDENLGAAKVELTVADLGEIDGAAAKIKVEGARYPEKLAQQTGR